MGIINRGNELLEPFYGCGVGANFSSPLQFLISWTNGESRRLTVLDLGCGEAKLLRLINRANLNVDYWGVDIASSPEVDRRTLVNEQVLVFDGVKLPFDQNSFDVIICDQVLEHVKLPEPLLAEMLRCLKEGGALFGSVSYLEPYHSLSIYNFTPYGLALKLEGAGFRDIGLWPGPDVVHFIVRLLFRRVPFLRQVVFSPIAWAVKSCELLGLLNSRTSWLYRLYFSGHIRFLCGKSRQ